MVKDVASARPDYNYIAFADNNFDGPEGDDRKSQGIRNFFRSKRVIFDNFKGAVWLE